MKRYLAILCAPERVRRGRRESVMLAAFLLSAFFLAPMCNAGETTLDNRDQLRSIEEKIKAGELGVREQQAQLKEAQQVRERARASGDQQARKAAADKVRAVRRNLKSTRDAVRLDRAARDELLRPDKARAAVERARITAENARVKAENAQAKTERAAAAREAQQARAAQANVTGTREPVDKAAVTAARAEIRAEKEKQRRDTEAAKLEVQAQREAMKPFKEEQRKQREQSQILERERTAAREAQRKGVPALVAPPTWGFSPAPKPDDAQARPLLQNP